jgi:hypothetical protein
LHAYHIALLLLLQILKKHDKQIRDRMMAANYLGSRALVKYSFLQQLYANEGVLALAGSLKNAFENIELRRGGHARTMSGAIPR